MKKITFITALLLSSLLYKTSTAQVHINYRENIREQPVWGPVGYDHVEYYYMPDIDAYYYVPSRQYIYQERGRWVFASSLPHRYRNYNVYTGYKVVVNEQRPYRNAGNYRTMFAPYKGRSNQAIIRDSHEGKYFGNKDHPEHSKWKDNQAPHNRNDQRYNP